MLPHTRHPTRDGVIVGARLVTWRQVEEWYVCRECGGKLVHHIARVNEQTFDYAECAECQSRDFISQRLFARQVDDWPDIYENLPDELKALFAQPEPTNRTADEAIAELFDL